MRVENRWILVLSSLIFTLAACASVPEAPKAVVQEILPGAPNEVATALISEMTRRQFTLTGKGTGYLAFDRPVDNAALWPKLDGAPGHLPRARVLMTLTPVGQETRVAADLMIIAAPGTAQERVVKAEALGVNPRIDDVLADASALVIADRGTSDPRVAFATRPINY